MEAMLRATLVKYTPAASHVLINVDESSDRRPATLSEPSIQLTRTYE